MKNKTAVKELVITKIIDAPREVVFKTWINQNLMAQWFGPKNYTTPICVLDAQPDGDMYLEMEDPDGNRYPMKGTFEEIEEPERIVFTASAFEDEEGNAKLIHRSTVTFKDENGGTKMTLNVVVLRADPSIKEALSGMKQGWSQSFDKLADLMAEI